MDRLLLAACCVLIASGLLGSPARSAAGESDPASCNLWPVAVRSDPGPAFVEGCTEYVGKYGGGSGTQSSWGPLDFSGFSCPADSCPLGAAGFICHLEIGYPCCIDTGTCIPLKQGNMSGPTQTGINYRFSQDTDQRQGICYMDYEGNGSRIVSVPITGALKSGCYPVATYARLFLTHIPGSGNQSLFYFNFLGTYYPEPVRVTPSTWGAIKTLYR